MKNLYLDCFSGISGNMFIGAMLDGGISIDYLKSELHKLPLPKDAYELVAETVFKCGIKGTYFDVRCTPTEQIRCFTELCELIRATSLSEYVKNTSLLILDNLARTESTLCGIPIEQLQLHEADVLLSIVGTAICLEKLEIKNIFVIQLCTGNGFAYSEQGPRPIPAPVTAELLRGFDVYAGKIEKELITPIGAAILHTLATEMPSDEAFRYETTAYGAGSYELEIPNLLRLYIYDDVTREDEECLSILETNIDDISPQILSYVCEKLLSHGAIDAWITPIFMKNGSPAHLVSALTKNNLVDACKEIIFSETSSLNIRVRHVLRTAIQRKIETITTRYGPVRCRLGIYQGKIIKISAEYDDCRLLAQKNNIPLKNVQSEAVRIASFKYGL